MNWSSQNRVIIQGISEPQVAHYAVQMKAYGTDIVATVSCGEKGQKVEDIPIFDLVEQAITTVGQVDTSLIFVPPYQVLDAAREAIAAGIGRIIIATMGVPPLDVISLLKYAKANNTLILGPGSYGVIIPEQVCLGKLKPQYYQTGTVGLISHSEYLSYEVAWELNQGKIGQSIVVNLGNEKIIGSGLPQWLSILNADPNTKAIVSVVQSISETKEVTAYCRQHDYDKPIVVYIVGLQTPQEKIFRNATTIMSNQLSASIPAVHSDRKTIAELKKAGIKVAKKLHEIPTLVQKALSGKN